MVTKMGKSSLQYFLELEHTSAQHIDEKELSDHWHNIEFDNIALHPLLQIGDIITKKITKKTPQTSCERESLRKTIVPHMNPWFSATINQLPDTTLETSTHILNTAISLRVQPHLLLLDILDQHDTRIMNRYGQESTRHLTCGLYNRARLRHHPSNDLWEAWNKSFTQARLAEKCLSLYACAIIDAGKHNPTILKVAKNIYQTIKSPHKTRNVKNQTPLSQACFWFSEHLNSLNFNLIEKETPSRNEKRWKHIFKKAGFQTPDQREIIKIGYSHTPDFTVKNDNHTYLVEFDGIHHLLWHFDERNNRYRKGPYNGTTLFQTAAMAKTVCENQDSNRTKIIRIPYRLQGQLAHQNMRPEEAARQIIHRSTNSNRIASEAYWHRSKKQVKVKPILQQPTIDLIS